MKPTNKEIAEMFRELGMLLEILGENPFKIRAYLNAARVIEELPDGLAQLNRSGEIIPVEGIGPAISRKINTIIETGNLPKLDEVRKSIPPGLLEMLAIPGLTARKINAIWKKLGITTVNGLAQACRQNRLKDLRGFNEESQREILRHIEARNDKKS